MTLSLAFPDQLSPPSCSRVDLLAVEKREWQDRVYYPDSAMSLIAHLKQIPDFRTQPRYPLWVILLLVIMGTMSGCQGYRALEDFVERHQRVLIELLELPYKRLPSFSTLRRIMVRLDFVASFICLQCLGSSNVANRCH